MAQQALTQYFRKPYQNMLGGLCSRPDPQQVPGNKYVQLDNAILNDHDLLEKAPGYILDGSPFSNEPRCFIRMLANYRVGTSVNSLIVAAFNDDATVVSTAGTLTSGSSPVTTNVGYPAENVYVTVDGGSPITLLLFYDTFSTGAAIANQIQSQVVSAGYPGFTCTYTGSAYVCTSGSVGPTSTVSYFTSDNGNSYAGYLKLTAASGATKVDGTSSPGALDSTYQVDFKQTFGDGTYKYIGYTTGTALFTHASSTVTGTGTAWSTNIKAGDRIGTGAHPSVWYKVQSVTNDTTIVLTSNYNETTTTSTSYMARIVLNLNNTPVSLSFNNKLVISNGADKMMQFDNTTMSRITDANAPLATCLEKHKNRLFAADNASTVYWSAVNDQTTWNAAGKVSVFPLDNGNIVAIKAFANSLLVFKDNGLVYRIISEFDQDSIGYPSQILKLDCPDNLGIIAGKTVVISKDNELLFMSETGVYAIDMYMRFRKMSWDINPDIQKLILKAVSTAAKSFPFSTQSQWNSGTYNGTRVTGSNQLSTYNDRLSITGGNNQFQNAASLALDTNNVAHVARCVGVTSSGTLSYTRYGTDLTVISENTFQYSALPSVWSTSPLPTGLSIGVAANGNVGMAFIYKTAATTSNVAYMERVAVGTAVFTNGSNAVTGTGTSWQTGATPLTAGSLIKNAVDGTFAVVSTVNSDTSITLTANYAGTSGNGAYVAWSFPVVVAANVSDQGYGGMCSSIAFVSNDPRICTSFPATVSFSLGGVATFYSRTGGVYTAVTVGSLGTGNTPVLRNSMYISGSNLTVSFTVDNNRILCYASSNGGSSWTLLENFAVTLASSDAIQVSRDGGGNSITGYSASGNILKRNHSTTTTTTLDSVSGSKLVGYVFYSGNDYCLNIAGTAPNQTERYTFLSSSVLADTTPNLLINTAYVGNGLRNNGAVFCSIAYGANSGEIVIRRISFQGTWTSAVTTDSTLSSWGTYVVTGEVDNGATVLQQIALGTTSSVGAPATITNGSIVSTDATQIYFQVTVTMTIGRLAAPVIGSITLNYFGAGQSGTAPSAFIFNSEMYLCATQSGQTANNTVLFLDRQYAWGNTSIPVTTFARMNQTLYAGSSTNGNVYRLKQGLNFNGSAYTMTAMTKEDMLGSLELRKEVSKVYVLYRVQASGTFTFSYRLDSYKTVGGSAWTDVVVDQTQLRQDLGGIEIPINKVCSSIQFKITQGDANVQVGILGFTVLYGTLALR